MESKKAKVKLGSTGLSGLENIREAIEKCPVKAISH
jgi:ferredoxin